ncbi:MOSC domain-containing protein YiiM [Lentibacillus halodurans]|uniref:MOSC domain-containing protein YiiM n=1 Tax=Lentibacillus halodurans TaxID=237679 RepID=A0A1I0YM67_9BACI|nr:MOSC domain-containing protein [Lentibacillus halodurans]SFB14505.1 MOSC domain-containing protein YiiM [Lentibacillus halodurans]
MTKPIVNKILTGKVKQMGIPNAENRMDRPWQSGMFKKSVDVPQWLGFTGFSEDEVADTKNHGGAEKAVFAYPATHYRYWREDLKMDDIDIGAMGENLVLEHADESNVCIGDTYRFGESVIQVSQPRRPCWKPARRYRVMDFALRIQNSGRTGWYYRVLQEGYTKAGMELELIERPYPEWTIAACNDVIYVKKEALRLAEQLASCELLADSWKRTLRKRLRGKRSSDEKRVYGPNKA